MGGVEAVVVLFMMIILVVGGIVLINSMKIDATSELKKDEFQKLLFDADQLKLKPKSSEKICDLKVTVYGELHGYSPFGIRTNQADLPTNLKILLGKDTAHPEVKKYEWFDCQKSTAVPLASLLDFGLDFGPENQLNYDLAPQAFFTVEEKIHAQIVLKSGPYKVDAVTQPNLKKYIFIPAGVVPLPYDMRAVFVVQNIPQRSYEMEIYYGQEINDLAPGQPYITNINPPK